MASNRKNNNPEGNNQYSNQGSSQSGNQGNSQSGNQGSSQSGNRGNSQSGNQGSGGTQGGTPQQHAEAGRQSHKNDR